MSLFKLGTVRVPHRKNTASMQPVKLGIPQNVLIPLSQHIGKPAIPAVKVGDKVFVGTLIGEADGPISASVHSSVSGTVKKIEEYLISNGRSCPAILIESDGEQTVDEKIAPPSVTTLEELKNAVRESGLVGLGGAGFPASVKLDPAKLASIDVIIVNGAECEPFITSDTRTMLDSSEYVKSALLKILQLSGIKKAYIGIEKNKPEAIAKMREIFASDERIEVEVLPSSYPQGAEKVIIYNTTGRIVPEGGLPSDIGALVMNVTSLAFLGKYLESGMPLIEKCVTVAGSAIKSPANVIAPIGMSVGSVIEAVGGFSEEPKKIMYGGPMMGNCIYDLNAPVIKSCNAITAFNEKDARIAESTACIHCGRCVASCPIGLNPTIFAKALNLADREDMAERLESAKLNLCMECGCCSFVCPAKRPLVEKNRLAKGELRAYKEAKRAEAARQAELEKQSKGGENK